MRLDKNCTLFVLLLCLQCFCSHNIYSQSLTDSLISPRYYNASYSSPSISHLMKYYKKVINQSHRNNDYKKNILGNIYLADTYRYDKKHDSSRYYLKVSKELINTYHKSDEFLKYQYFKANASSLYFENKFDSLLSSVYSAIKLAKKNNYDSLEMGDLEFLRYTAFNMTYVYDSALYYLEKSLALDPKKNKNQRLYKSLHRLCALYKNNGYLKKAENALFEALKKADSTIPRQKSITYYNLGKHFSDIRDYEKSAYYFNLKLHHDSISHIVNLVDQSNTLIELGYVFHCQKKYLSALKYYFKAKQLLAKTHSDQLIKAYQSIGQIYSVLDSLKLAEFNLKKSVSLSLNPQYLITDFTKAFAYIELGKFKVIKLKDKEGIEHIETGLKILEHAYGKNSRLLRYPYNYLSDAYKLLYADYNTSLSYLQKSLNLNLSDSTNFNYYQKIDANLSISPIEFMSTLSRKINLLRIWITNKNDDKERELLLKALFNTIITFTDAEEIIRLRIKNSNSKLTRSSLHKEYYAKALKGLLLLYNKTLDKEYLDLIYKYSAKNKAISLQESLNESEAKFNLLPDSLIKLESDYKKRLGSLKELLNREYSKQQPNKNRIKVWENKIQNIVIQNDLLLHKFEIDYPEYYNLKHNHKLITVNEVQSLLNDNQTLVEYTLVDKNLLFIFGINKNEFRFIPVEYPDSLFQNLEIFLSLVNNDHIHKFNVKDFNDFKHSSLYLYHKLISPIEHLIGDNELIINPDDKLWYLPFELLLTDSINHSSNYKDFSYLIKRNPINYAYSTLLFLKPLPKKKKPPYNLLTMVPSYDKDKDFTILILEGNKANRGDYSPLPASLKEAEHIHKLLGGDLLIGEQATEKTFNEIADKYSILHLAMHAVIDNINPQYSKLVFTQSADTIEDNFLNTYEIYNRSLNAQMAVLSSCNSGSGKIQKGEGLISIARAFLYAGCPSLVITLWSVNDQSSAKLMQYYYDFLKQGMDKSRALQQSKLKYLESATPIQQHPYYWAAYTIIGLNDPIDLNRSKNIYYIISGLLLLSLLFSKRIKILLNIIKH